RRGARLTKAGRDEGDNGILGNVEEVGTLEVGVTLLYARRDRLDVDGRVDFGIRWRSFGLHHGPGGRLEHTALVVKHVLTDELRRGVFRVELPIRDLGNSRN